MEKQALLIMHILLAIFTLGACTLYFLSYLKDRDSDNLLIIVIWISLAVTIILSSGYLEKKKKKPSEGNNDARKT
jgi:hypothetical protein